MIQFSENIYGRFLNRQCYESVDLCNNLFPYKLKDNNSIVSNFKLLNCWCGDNSVTIRFTVLPNSTAL